MELLSSTYTDPSNPEHIIGRSEIERRESYMEGLEATSGRSYSILVELVRQCLHNTPERRPSSKDLLSRLRAVRSEVEVAFGGNKQLNIANVLIVKEMKIKDKRIQEITGKYAKVRTCNKKISICYKKNFCFVYFGFILSRYDHIPRRKINSQ